MIFRPKALAISSALAFALVEARRKAWSWALCSSLRVKDQALNRIRSRLHGEVDELADVFQSAGLYVKHVGCRVTDDLRFAALGIAIIGIE